jgi:hypothetical protein
MYLNQICSKSDKFWNYVRHRASLSDFQNEVYVLKLKHDGFTLPLECAALKNKSMVLTIKLCKSQNLAGDYNNNHYNEYDSPPKGFLFFIVKKSTGKVDWK